MICSSEEEISQAENSSKGKEKKKSKKSKDKEDTKQKLKKLKKKLKKVKKARKKAKKKSKGSSSDSSSSSDEEVWVEKGSKFTNYLETNFNITLSKWIKSDCAPLDFSNLCAYLLLL